MNSLEKYLISGAFSNMNSIPRMFLGSMFFINNTFFGSDSELLN